MATETIEIAQFAVETASSIKDLKNNISALKKEMEGLTIGSEAYSEALTELQKNQTALKNAMHATTVDGEEEGKTLEGIAKAANGLGTSYNALVKRMADLTQEFRATEDAARRSTLGGQIKALNEELKRLDQDRGIHSRNVGNYVSHWEGLGDALRNIPPTLGPLRKQMGDIGQTMGMISKQPLLSIVGLLAPVIMKIASSLKENKTALDAVKKGMEALQPIFDFLQGILDKIAGWFAQIVDWLVEFADKNKEVFKNFISGAVGVGNAILQFLLTPIRNVVDAVKGMGSALKNVFKGDFKQAAEDAKKTAKDISDNFKKGFSFKDNFAAGKEVGEQFVAGLGSAKVKADAKKAGKDTMQEFLKSLENEVIVEEDFSKVFVYDPDGEIRAQNQQMFDDLIAQRDAYDAKMAERARVEQEAADAAAQQERDRLRQRREAYADFAGAVSGIFSSLADIYDANNEADEQAAKKAKQLRTASAIIATISGAIAAYMNTIESVKLPNLAIPLAVVNAAAVLAAGYAQVKQINAVQVGSGGTSPAPALAQAPSFSPAIPQIRSVTGQSEEERLNRMAGDSRVYLVYSDLEIADTRQRVRVRETEF